MSSEEVEPRYPPPVPPPPVPPPPVPAPPAPARPRRPVPLGLLAFVLAVLLLVAEGLAVYLAGAGHYLAGTVLGQVLLVATAIPFVLGLYAAARGRNRGWGIAAAVVSLVANPLILTQVLDFFGGL